MPRSFWPARCTSIPVALASSSSTWNGLPSSRTLIDGDEPRPARRASSHARVVAAPAVFRIGRDDRPELARHALERRVVLRGYGRLPLLHQLARATRIRGIVRAASPVVEVGFPGARRPQSARNPEAIYRIDLPAELGRLP